MKTLMCEVEKTELETLIRNKRLLTQVANLGPRGPHSRNALRHSLAKAIVSSTHFLGWLDQMDQICMRDNVLADTESEGGHMGRIASAIIEELGRLSQCMGNHFVDGVDGTNHLTRLFRCFFRLLHELGSFSFSPVPLVKLSLCIDEIDEIDGICQLPQFGVAIRSLVALNEISERYVVALLLVDDSKSRCLCLVYLGLELTFRFCESAFRIIVEIVEQLVVALARFSHDRRLALSTYCTGTGIRPAQRFVFRCAIQAIQSGVPEFCEGI